MHPAFLIFFILSFVQAALAMEVKVRLPSQKQSLSLSGLNIKINRVATGQTFQALVLKPIAKRKWIVTDRDTGEIVRTVVDSKLEISGHSLRMNLKSMPSHLIFFAQARNLVEVVARMDLETYLARVLPSEMPTSWPLEAMKAQAVAARTFAFFRREQQEKAKAHFHLESTVMDQVFNWLDEEDLGSHSHRNIRRALEETKGLVLIDQNDQPFAAYYHADCGGQTEEPRNVWGIAASQGTTKDTSCPKNPMATWSLHVSKEELAKKFALASVEEIVPTHYSDSGRVTQLKIVTASQVQKKLSGQDFRAALGFDRLRSTRFRLEKQGDGFRFIGQGYGHGVGLCQWGARSLAANGKLYQEILKHYYPRANLGVISTASAALPALQSL